jgi:ferric iron reductase protein FhuF
MLSLEDFGPAELNWPRTWRPAADLVNGSAIDDLLAAACRRWPSNPHIAAALAWKSYTYWVTLPTVIGYVAERVVPDVRPDNVEFQIHEAAPFVSIRLIRPDVTSLVGDTSLLAELRKGLLDEHLDPMLEQFRTRVRLGRRTLLGSLASAVCYAVVRARDALPAHAVSDAHHILDALGVADLVDLGPDESGELRVQRHTCCLAFALPTPKICSGCVLPRA